jgi:hypothetical protein
MIGRVSEGRAGGRSAGSGSAQTVVAHLTPTGSDAHPLERRRLPSPRGPVVRGIVRRSEKEATWWVRRSLADGVLRWSCDWARMSRTSPSASWPSARLHSGWASGQVWSVDTPHSSSSVNRPLCKLKKRIDLLVRAKHDPNGRFDL